MNRKIHGLGRLRQSPIAVALGMACLSMSELALANDAEIVMVQGTVEVRDQATGTWRPALANQVVRVGEFVRTGESSQMALLVKDKTQVRLNQQSMFQIKQAGDEKGGTQLELTSGRMWAQAKQFLTGFLRGTTGLVNNNRRLTVTTPTSTIGIRGTDWEVNVEDGGNTTVAVFSGEVAVGNELGEVYVGPSEQASVQNGKAPVKIVLTNAKDRVQWVTAVRAEVDRYPDFAKLPAAQPVREALLTQRLRESRNLTEALLQSSTGVAAGAWLLAADFALVAGEPDVAVRRLVQGMERFPSDDRFPAYQARAALLRGDAVLAQQIVRQAQGRFPASAELALVDGELNRLAGDGAAAVARFTAATLAAPSDPRAWQGLGFTLAEQENFDPARAALKRAIELSPKAASAQADLAALETRANRLLDAQAAIDASLELAPDDYVAWTSRGILLLNQGHPDAALQALLKAGLLEPRYAKAQIYTAIAWAQLGRDDAALAALERAKKADPNDPLPYFYEAQIHRDNLSPMAAIAAARAAMDRFGFLKSLGPIATDRQGNANLGAAYALFGLESWAKRVAQETQHPFFAGSYLFSAERQSEPFVKNSSLIQGYLTDPTMFGASPQRSTLMAVPGGYAAAEFKYNHLKATSSTAPSLILNGYSTSVIPVAGFAQVEQSRFRPGSEEFNASAPSLIMALGVRPSAQTGLFLYRDEFRPTIDNVPLDTAGDRISGNVVSNDVGGQWQIDPATALWVRFGNGVDDTSVVSHVKEQSRRYRRTDDDKGFRFTALRASGEWTVGYESGKTLKPEVVLSTGTRSKSQIDTSFESQGERVFGSWKGNSGQLLFQVDLNASRIQAKRDSSSTVTTLSNGRTTVFVTPSDLVEEELVTPSFGLAWAPSKSATYRLALQDFVRPASAISLATLNTVGITLDVPGIEPGGRMKRLRAQGEWELGDNRYVMAFLDHRDIANLYAATKSFNAASSLEQYDRLRQGGSQFVSPEALEGTVTFPAGKVRTAGLVFEQIVSPQWSWSGSYIRAQTHNELYPEVPVPRYPEHTIGLGLTWFAPERWVIQSHLNGRTERTTDAQGTQWLDPDWDMSLSATWQDHSKRKLFEIYAARLFRKDDSASYGVRAVWRY